MTSKQIRFMTELFCCTTINEACKKAGISNATAYRWIHDDAEFRKNLQIQKTKALEDVSTKMQVGFSDAVEELMRIIRNPEVSEQVKINAIDCLFRNARPIMEEVDILNRLQAVEEAMWEEGETDAV